MNQAQNQAFELVKNCGITMQQAAEGFARVVEAAKTLERDPAWRETMQLAWDVRRQRMGLCRKVRWLLRTGHWPPKQCPILQP